MSTCENQVVIVTGGNSGIERFAALAFAAGARAHQMRLPRPLPAVPAAKRTATFTEVFDMGKLHQDH